MKIFYTLYSVHSLFSLVSSNIISNSSVIQLLSLFYLFKENKQANKQIRIKQNQPTNQQTDI